MGCTCLRGLPPGRRGHLERCGVEVLLPSIPAATWQTASSRVGSARARALRLARLTSCEELGIPDNSSSDTLVIAGGAAGRLDCGGRTAGRLGGGAPHSSSARSNPLRPRLECRNYKYVEPIHLISLLVGKLAHHYCR